MSCPYAMFQSGGKLIVVCVVCGAGGGGCGGGVNIACVDTWSL